MLEKLPEFVGQALRGRRAGLENILIHRIGAASRLEVSSPAFADYAPIPTRFTADGSAVSPPLEWRNVPAEATTLALIVEDADSPTSEPLVHAIVVDIDPMRPGIAEGELTEDDMSPTLLVGRNSFLKTAWLPPDPPPGHGVHRYAFQLFALGGGRLAFSEAPGRRELVNVIRDHAIACGYFLGTYARNNRVELPVAGKVVNH